MDDFTQGYIDCALWCSLDDDDQPLDRNYTTSDIEEDDLGIMERECQAFQADNQDDLEAYCLEVAVDTGMEHAGHDFWLTRNGHGATILDRDLGALGDRLYQAMKRYGETGLYVGDDGQLYVY